MVVETNFFKKEKFDKNPQPTIFLCKFFGHFSKQHLLLTSIWLPEIIPIISNTKGV
jgi:hypothetical protein